MTLSTKIELHYSGGSANTDPGACLGGQISSTTVTGQYVTGLTITGVSIVKAFSNALGSQVLTFHSVADDGRQQLRFDFNDPYIGSDTLSLKVDSNTYNVTRATSNANVYVTGIANQINADGTAPCTAGVVTNGGTLAKYLMLTAKVANTEFVISPGDYAPDYFNIYSGWTTAIIEYRPATPDFGTNAALEWGGVYSQFGSDGTYRVKSPTGALIYDVTFASIPSVYEENTVTVNLDNEETLENIRADDMLWGTTQYTCFYIKNTDTSSRNVILYINQQPTGNSDLEIGLDPVGVGNGSTTGVATTIANINVLPSGVTFTAPAIEDDGLDTGSMTTGECRAFWIKRYVAPGSYPPVTPSLSELGFTVY